MMSLSNQPQGDVKEFCVFPAKKKEKGVRRCFVRKLPAPRADPRNPARRHRAPAADSPPAPLADLSAPEGDCSFLFRELEEYAMNRCSACPFFPESATDMMKSGSSHPSAADRLIILPWGKSLSISVKSLKARFLRNLVTVGSLVLAVAFLGFSLAMLEFAAGYLEAGQGAALSELTRAGYDASLVDGRAVLLITAKDRWLLGLSLVTCAVGIVNAQLMSVTERFREIGTMKCLGALDSFVLRLFLLEAGMQGVAGASLGGLAGLLMAALVSLARFGSNAVLSVSASGLGRTFFIAVGVGLVLSLVGVSYPAIVAARMRPVEAMRAQG